MELLVVDFPRWDQKSTSGGYLNKWRKKVLEGFEIRFGILDEVGVSSTWLNP